MTCKCMLNSFFGVKMAKKYMYPECVDRDIKSQGLNNCYQF